MQAALLEIIQYLANCSKNNSTFFMNHAMELH